MPCGVVKAFVVLVEKYRHKEGNTVITILQDLVKSATIPYKYPRDSS